MLSLEQHLQQSQSGIADFGLLARRVLEFMPNVLSGYYEKRGYRLYYSESAGTTKTVRPINMALFWENPETFDSQLSMVRETIAKIRDGQKGITAAEKSNLDKTLYTIQQSIGAGLDLLVGGNSARKHAGSRFEELLRTVFTDIGITNKRIVLKVPYSTEEGDKVYSCENDAVLSPYKEVRSTTKTLDPHEIVVSIKTTSKDRMGKMFIDKMLLEKFLDQKQQVIGIFLNDVQRKGKDNVSFTLVPGLFMVYREFLVEVDGVYYLDPPPTALKLPYSKYMKPFSELVTTDITRLLTP